MVHQEIENDPGDRARKSIDRAETMWRRFLLGKSPHPGEFEQHAIVVDTASRTSGSISPFLNRYFLRTVSLNILFSPTAVITHTKLCKLIIIGFIDVPQSRKWEGTKLHVRSGMIGENCVVPADLIRYWNDEADRTASAFASLSPKQAGRIRAEFAKVGAERLRKTEIFRAMSADIASRGTQAFECTQAPIRKEHDD